MKVLLDFILQYLQVLYLNPSYRFVDSRNRGLAEVDASITMANDILQWRITNERGQIDITGVAQRYQAEDNWFWLSRLREHLEGRAETPQNSAADLADWLTRNLNRIEQMFYTEENAAKMCEKLAALRHANARKNFGGPPAG